MAGPSLRIDREGILDSWVDADRKIGFAIYPCKREATVAVAEMIDVGGNVERKAFMITAEGVRVIDLRTARIELRKERRL